MRHAERMKRLGTETVFEVLVKALELEAQGRKVVHLEIGEPDFDTPANIVQAGIDALKAGHTHYTPSAGLPKLREVIAGYVSETLRIEALPSQVMITPGAKPIMFFSIIALAEAGDEVIYPNPGFPIYESMIDFVGATPVPIQLREERGFRFDVDELREKVSSRTKMIIINSPQNPTGGILTKEDLEAIASLAIERDIMVLSDEVYERIIYEGEHFSIASLPGMQERTILLNGFSKTYAMTGWRLGYGVMPEGLLEQVNRLMINSNSCTATFTQYAGMEALTGPQDDVVRMAAAFKERRDTIVEGLNAIPGIRCFKPRGAFYVFPNIEGTGLESKELQEYLLDEAGVACLPGTSFGEYGQGFLRLSYANSLENIRLALARIREALAKR